MTYNRVDRFCRLFNEAQEETPALQTVDLSQSLDSLDKQSIQKANWLRGCHWTFNVEQRVLVHNATGYEIDLDRMSSTAEVLDWICQVAKKRWCSHEGVGELVSMLMLILNPQDGMCSWGQCGTREACNADKEPTVTITTGVGPDIDIDPREC